jgi:hypothetical protein
MRGGVNLPKKFLEDPKKKRRRSTCKEKAFVVSNRGSAKCKKSSVTTTKTQ